RPGEAGRTGVRRDDDIDAVGARRQAVTVCNTPAAVRRRCGRSSRPIVDKPRWWGSRSRYVTDNLVSVPTAAPMTHDSRGRGDDRAGGRQVPGPGVVR